MSHVEEIQNVIVPTMVKKKVFGNRTEFISHEFDPTKKIEDLKMSDVIFLTVNVKEENVMVKKRIVVKFQPHDQDVRRFAHSDEQFFNEIYAYEVILPLLNRNDLCTMFPKFYSGVSGAGVKDYVVLEDITPGGYRMSKEMLHLDLDHVRVALTQLGRFHAMSYAAKTNDPERFFNIIESIKETHWLKDKEASFYFSFKNGFERAVKNLTVTDTERVQRFTRQLERKLQFFMEISSPEEPMAVVCHGDFCKNNIMYRYCEQGKPVDAKLIDLATVRYASPAVDISLLLFLNLSTEMRSSHLDELLRVYHDSLSTTLPGTKVPTLRQIQEEFKRRSVYGLLHCLYFVPIVAGSISGECVFDFTEFCKTDKPEERGEMFSKVGGRKGTELVSQLVEECLNKGYL